MISTTNKCFIIMPITTPPIYHENYFDNEKHFSKVLHNLFIPAVESAGYKAMSPESTGSQIIHADIIENLSICDMVLCDMSILNPNVFFEFGIRTALDKPVALVKDDKTLKIPFDTSLIHCFTYTSNPIWDELDNQIELLSKHIISSTKKSNRRNSLWKYFGIAKSGIYSAEEADIGEKLELIQNEIKYIKGSISSLKTHRKENDFSSEDINNVSSKYLSLNKELVTIGKSLENKENKSDDEIKLLDKLYDLVSEHVDYLDKP